MQGWKQPAKQLNAKKYSWEYQINEKKNEKYTSTEDLVDATKWDTVLNEHSVSLTTRNLAPHIASTTLTLSLGDSAYFEHQIAWEDLIISNPISKFSFTMQQVKAMRIIKNQLLINYSYRNFTEDEIYYGFLILDIDSKLIQTHISQPFPIDFSNQAYILTQKGCYSIFESSYIQEFYTSEVKYLQWLSDSSYLLAYNSDIVLNAYLMTTNNDTLFNHYMDMEAGNLYYQYSPKTKLHGFFNPASFELIIFPETNIQNPLYYNILELQAGNFPLENSRNYLIFRDEYDIEYQFYINENGEISNYFSSSSGLL